MPHGHHQPVNLGLLGSGFVAEFYMAGLDDVPGAHVVANYSRSAERAEHFGRRHGVPRQYTDVEALCADDEVDMVIVALPNHMHVDAIRTVAAAGRAIVCTKPLARNADEAAEIVRIVRDAGVLHGYAETEVFSPSVVKAREIIESGAIGEVI
jgi:predicted dehydrogenase